MKKYLIILLTLSANVNAAQFDAELANNWCRGNVYYTFHKTKCLELQKQYFETIESYALTKKQLSNALWYGVTTNEYGEASSVDYYHVMQRAEYLKK